MFLFSGMVNHYLHHCINSSFFKISSIKILFLQFFPRSALSRSVLWLAIFLHVFSIGLHKIIGSYMTLSVSSYSFLGRYSFLLIAILSLLISPFLYLSIFLLLPISIFRFMSLSVCISLCIVRSPTFYIFVFHSLYFIFFICFPRYFSIFFHPQTLSQYSFPIVCSLLNLSSFCILLTP